MAIVLPYTAEISDLADSTITASADLADSASRWTATLSPTLRGDGALVGLALPPSAAFFSALFGIWQSGATALLLDTALKPDERQRVCNFAGLSCVICVSDDNWPTTMLTAPDKEDAAITLHTARLTAGGLGLTTSGTTGTPKIVMLSAEAIEARIRSNLDIIGHETLSRTLQTLSLTFGHGLIGSALTTLFAGGRLVLPARGPVLAMKLGPIIDEHAISFLTSVPSFWHMPLKFSPRPISSSLQRVHVGSAPLAAHAWTSIANWCGVPVHNCYGMTETANWVAMMSSEQGVQDGLVGESIDGEFSVDRVTGEVWVRTPGLMDGYLGQRELSAQVLKDGWYKTGDTGSLGEDGSLLLTGRSVEQINRAGSKVSPSEVDMLVEGHPDVVQACAFAQSDEVGGEAVAVAVVLREGATAGSAELAKWCGEKARAVLVPQHWYFVSSLCRNDRGKLDRQGQCRLLARVDG
ncbi:MAG: AMP-binding protein [Anderseniella sp.]